MIGFAIIAAGVALLSASLVLDWPFSLIPGAVCLLGGSAVLVVHDVLTTWQRRKRRARRGGYLDGR